MNKSIKSSAIAALLALGVTGCSTTMGTFQENSHYVYPNSNVQALGQVASEVKKMYFFAAPGAGTMSKMVDEATASALEKAPGADLLINVSVDTTITPFPVIPGGSVKVSIRGTAAKMEVGIQELSQR